jgi:hypothetical protein
MIESWEQGHQKETTRWSDKQVNTAKTANTEHIEGARRNMMQAIAEKYRMSLPDLTTLQADTPEDESHEDGGWQIAGTVNGVNVSIKDDEVTLNGILVENADDAREISSHIIRVVQARDEIDSEAKRDTVDTIKYSAEKKQYPENLATLVNKVIGTQISEDDLRGLHVERNKRLDYGGGEVENWEVKGTVNGVKVELEGYFDATGIARAGPTRLDDIELGFGDRDEVFYHVTDAIKSKDGTASEHDEARTLRDRVLGRAKNA